MMNALGFLCVVVVVFFVVALLVIVVSLLRPTKPEETEDLFRMSTSSHDPHRVSETDISMIADIPVEGRTPEQIEAQLRSKIDGFHQEALRRYESSGYALKRAEILTDDPGKCVLVTELVQSEVAMKLHEPLTALWNEVAYPHECVSTSPFAIFELLVEELVDIGCCNHHNHGPCVFRLPDETQQKNPRVIEIGRQLYRLANNKIDKMQEAANRISRVLVAGAATDLSHHWHEIGMEEWQQGGGECWLM